MGKTSSHSVDFPAYKKHPHVHGEDFASDDTDPSAAETPPRAWGRLARQSCASRLMRNTPTCMGKTIAFSLLSISVGETPPRAWGRP